jgi:hypothetical protein
MQTSLRESAVKLGEDRCDLLVSREVPLARGAQSAINAGKFLRRRLILTTLEAGIDFERQFRKGVLDVLRPFVDALKHALQGFGSHAGQTTPRRNQVHEPIIMVDEGLVDWRHRQMRID